VAQPKNRNLLPRAFAGLLVVALAALPWQPAQAQFLHAAAPVDAQSLRTLHPQAQVIEVSAEDYPALAQRLRQSGYRPGDGAAGRQLAANALPAPAPGPEPDLPPLADEEPVDDCARQPRQRTDGQVGIQVNIGNMRHSSGGRGSGNDAAVIFVIVGTVVLVVWTVYAIKYLADRARGVPLCGERASEWSLSSTSLNAGRSQQANFNGLRYVGTVSQEAFGFGIGAEIGQSEVLLAEAGTLRLRGLYWLAGPLLRWRLSPAVNPSYFQMEFLAGSTENNEMGVIAVAKLGFNFGLTDRVRLGLSYGAMNLNLHEQGIILDRSQTYTLWGLDMGYRF
jgi:hypothetical protein